MATENNDNENSGRGGRGTGMEVNPRLETLYDIFDTIIEKVNLPENRVRALKYGVRAVGEFFIDEEGNKRGGNSSGRSHSGGSHSSSSSRSSSSGSHSKKG